MTEHDWCVFVLYKLTEGQAAAAVTGAKVNLTKEMMHADLVQDGLPIGCYVCEVSYREGKGTSCPGQPPGKLEYVQEAP